MSDGLEIKVNLGIDSNVDDIVNPSDPDDEDDTPNTGNNNRPNTGLE